MGSVSEGWKVLVENFHSLLRSVVERIREGAGKLRFDLCFVTVSDVASQYFCERKVEMKYMHGEVETKRMTIGIEAHEKLLEDTVRVKIEIY